MEPLEFMERLAALVPRPRLHLIRFHGVLAPNAKLRSQIVPAPAERVTETSTEDAHAQGETPRMSWARLLKRVFDIDVEHCPNCGAALKIIACPEPRRRAAIEDPPVIVKILTHLGLPTRAPPRSPSSSSRFIPNNLSNRIPLANASRRRRSLCVRASGSITNLSALTRPLSGRTDRYNSGFFVKQKWD